MQSAPLNWQMNRQKNFQLSVITFALIGYLARRIALPMIYPRPKRTRAINLVESEANILLELAKLRHAQGESAESLRLAREALLITQRSEYVYKVAYDEAGRMIERLT